MARQADQTAHILQALRSNPMLYALNWCRQVYKWVAMTDDGRCLRCQGQRCQHRGPMLDMTSLPGTRVLQPEAVDMTKLRNHSYWQRPRPSVPTDERCSRHDRESKAGGRNGSGASGTATLTATDDGGLKVVIHSKAWCRACSTPSTSTGQGTGSTSRAPLLKEADTDGDGVITNEEGMGEYGLIFFR